MAKIGTDSFQFELPPDWTIESLGPPATVIGPKSECVMVNSVVIIGDGLPSDYDTVKRALEENVREAMEDASQERELMVAQKLTESLSSNGKVFYEIHYRTNDGNTFFSEFSIAGPRNVVLVTVEGDRESMGSVSIVKRATEEITWFPSRKKPFWKLW